MLSKETLKNGAITFSIMMIALATHQLFIAPRIAKLAKPAVK